MSIHTDDQKPVWVCARCGQEVAWDEVTYEEEHDVRAGGCGGQCYPKSTDAQEPMRSPAEVRAELEHYEFLIKQVDASRDQNRLIIGYRAVEALGGWIAVCNWSVADLHFRRNEFIKFYAAAKPLKEQKVLAGLVELDNKSRGYFDKVPEPAMIRTSEQLKRLEAPSGAGK